MSFIKQLSANAKSGMILAPLLDNYYSVGVFPDEVNIVVSPNKERDTAFHPSSHGMSCIAEMYASMHPSVTLAQKKHSASTQRIFQIGHAVHGLLQEALIDMGLTEEKYIEHEYRMTDQRLVLDNNVDWRTDPEIEKALWWCRGYADVSHCEIPGVGDVLVDIKTCSSWAFNNVGQDKGFWPKYEAQAQLYLDWHDVDRAVVLYMSKDTPHAFKERHIERDPDFAEAIYERWTEVAERVAANAPPACHCSPEKACVGRAALEAAVK